MEIAVNEKRNSYKALRYKKAINQCCDPECNFGFGLTTHHITPIGKGGTDNYSNFIVLCSKCHGANHNHKAEDIRIIELQTYKLYAERLILGFTSKDMSDEDFEMFLHTKSKNQEMPEIASGCPVIDERIKPTHRTHYSESSAILSLVCLDGEDSDRYHYYRPLYSKNGKKYLIIGLK